MPTANRISDIDQVDAFLARPKTLLEAQPAWIQGSRPSEMQIIWNVEDDVGIVSGHLRFVLPKANMASPSISLIWRNYPICRVDIEDDGECHPNPPDASLLGLEAEICGSHVHSWLLNRNYVLNTPHTWDIPYRCKTPPQVRRLNQAFPWLADQVNIKLRPHQHIVELPPQDDLLDLR